MMPAPRSWSGARLSRRRLVAHPDPRPAPTARTPAARSRCSGTLTTADSTRRLPLGLTEESRPA